MVGMAHSAADRRRRNGFSEFRFLLRGRVGVWLATLLFIALVRGVVYTFVIPPWQHPDEPAHFEHVRYIAEKGRLPAPDAVDLPIRREIVISMRAYDYWPHGAPSLDDPAMTQPYGSPVGFSTFVQPRLYYIAAAAWLRPWLGVAIEGQVYAARMFSVLLHLGLIAAGFLAVRVFYPENRSLAVAAGAFLAFLPGLTDIMSSINNDVLLNLEAALFFLLMAWVFRRGPRWRLIVAAIGLAIAAVFTKRTGVVLAGLLPIAWAAYLLRFRRGRVLAVVIVLLLLAAVAGAVVFYSNAGDEARPAIDAWFYRYFRAGLEQTLVNLVSAERQAVYLMTARIVFISFWAAFGWRDVMLALPWYWIPLGATALAALGLVLGEKVGRAGHRKARGWRASFTVFALLAVGLAWAAAVARSQAYQGATAYLSHGRYAYVAILPFAFLLVKGLQAWVPLPWRPASLWVFILLVVSFDAVSFLGYLVPFYYPST